jgi:hypothetical protein
VLVSEIATRVKRQFGDEAGAQITDSDVIRWVNDAQTEIAIANDLLQVSASATTTAGTQKYTIPTNLLILRSVKWKGVKLQALSMEEADNIMVANDTTSQGTPTAFWQFARQIYLWPTPSTSNATDLVIYYTRQPVQVTATTDTPELPVQYHPRIVEYCIAQAAELDDNLQHYQMKMAQFETGVTKLKDNADWENQDYYPGITAMPRDYGEAIDWYA